jgi:hypothetical protein
MYFDPGHPTNGIATCVAHLYGWRVEWAFGKAGIELVGIGQRERRSRKRSFRLGQYICIFGKGIWFGYF